jgi:D-arabinose 1-dehydrogenase-like Zn-dependent alcohol dehydrogenase
VPRTMTAMSVTSPGAPLSAVELPVPDPGPGQVRVAVRASGVCAADVGTAAQPESRYGFPLTPGHEIAGAISAVGEGVEEWRLGDRVAVGWFGGSCGRCAACQTGDPVHCGRRQTPGVDYPGGWAEEIVVPADALARIPDGLSFAEAAPMGCAGVTVLNALRNASLRPGATVAVFGLGGLGHLAVAFADALGFRVVALARGAERKLAACRLGALGYIDTTREDAATALNALGGADLIISTASSTAAVSGLIDGLRTGGRLTLIGVDAGALTLPAAALVMKGLTVTGSLTGSARDVEETMRFAQLTGVRPVLEHMALTDAAEAVHRIVSGDVRFRIVLETGDAS